MADEWNSGSSSERVARKKRGETWARRMAEVSAFVEAERRLPRRSPTHPEETRLAGWLRYQRRRGETLSESQRAQLERLPGFEWYPNDAAWDDKLDDYRRFATEQGRRASHHGADRAERSLAVWYRNQRKRLRAERLPKHRADELRQILGLLWDH